jgi:TRAP-type C4-dicarboxylate transport system permease small subunit
MESRPTTDWGITRIARVISLIGLVGLLLFAGITVGEVLLRWLFNYPILGVSDVSSLVVTVAVASCFPLVFAERRSITVRFAGNLLGKRVNSVLEAFGTLVTLGMFFLIAWQLLDYAVELAESDQTTWVVLWPMSPWYIVAAILLALCVPVLAVTVYLQARSESPSKDESVIETDDTDTKLEESQ